MKEHAGSKKTRVQQLYKTIIFDLDGTLIDTLTDIAEAANAVLEKMAFPQHHPDSYRTFVGDGLLALAGRMVPAGTADHEVRAAADLFRIAYKNCWDKNASPYPGIMRMLETLNQHPLNLAVLSNKPDDFTQLFVNRFFPEKMFGQVMGNRSGLPRKPDPTAAHAIAGFFGSENSSCLLVGDSGVDMQTGQNAGMTSLGVSWGFRGRQELIESGADLIIDRPSELLSHVFINR